MIIYGDGTWVCGGDEAEEITDSMINPGAVIIPDSSELAAKAMQYRRVSVTTDENGRAVDAVEIPDEPDREAELLAELARLDLQTVRPLRAIAAGTATDEDRHRLSELEKKAEGLRGEMAEIQLKNE